MTSEWCQTSQLSLETLTVANLRVIEGGRIAIHGTDFAVDHDQLPAVHIGDKRARVVFASPSRLEAIVPSGLTSKGLVPVHVEGAGGDTATVEIAATFATGLHQVDNPIFDREGNLYVTYSGTRGQQVPVSIFRVRPNGTRETFSSGVVNPTSMAIDADGRIYMSSRFEGTVYRLMPVGSVESFATDLGVACGLAFSWTARCLSAIAPNDFSKIATAARRRSASLPPQRRAFHRRRPRTRLRHRPPRCPRMTSSSDEQGITAPTARCSAGLRSRIRCGGHVVCRRLMGQAGVLAGNGDPNCAPVLVLSARDPSAASSAERHAFCRPGDSASPLTRCWHSASVMCRGYNNPGRRMSCSSSSANPLRHCSRTLTHQV